MAAINARATPPMGPLNTQSREGSARTRYLCRSDDAGHLLHQGPID